MKKSLIVGPIKKAENQVATVYSTVRKQMNQMKIGEFFEITGEDKAMLSNLRAAISYYSKQDNCAVKTSMSGKSMRVEKARSTKKSTSVSTKKATTSVTVY